MTTGREQAPALHLRCSDHEREQVAERLREAAAEGRIDLTELDNRLAGAYAATTGADLALVVRDLPEPGRATALRTDDAPTSRFAVAAFGFFSRRNRWVAPGTFTAVSLWSGGLIDLTEARFTERTTRVHAFALWSGMKIVVPADVDVQVRGLSLFGLFGKRGNGSGPPRAPRIVIDGLALFGAVITRRRPR